MDTEMGEKVNQCAFVSLFVILPLELKTTLLHVFHEEFLLHFFLFSVCVMIFI